MGCDKTTNEANAKKAKEQGAKDRDYGPLTINIDNAKDGVVTFRTKGSDKAYDIKWTFPDAWTECPTDASPNAKGVDRTAYLHYKYVANLPAEVQAFFRAKWPESEPAPFDYTEVELAVSKLELFGRLEGEVDSRTFTIDLDKPVDIDLSPVDVNVPGQAKKLHLVSARITANKDIEATINLLDPFDADPFQRLIIADKTKVKLRLSQDGASKFGAAGAFGMIL
jgi:hypothetical protein